MTGKSGPENWGSQRPPDGAVAAFTGVSDDGCQPVVRLTGMRITVPAGGVGAARFLRGLKAEVPDAEITVIGNTGDDITLFGLHVSPDLDTVMYTLGGGIDEEQGWGRAGDSRRVLSELAAYGAGPGWFGLGDLDIATHLHRTSMLAAGLPLSAVTTVLCQRWQPGVRLLPMSDDRVETHVVLADDEGERRAGVGAERGWARSAGAGKSQRGGEGSTVHFQEWWVRMGAQVPATGFVFAGAAQASPAPGVLEAIAEADVILMPPSNPVVSIGTILAVPGIAEAMRAKTVVGVSPIIGGAPVRGMADKCLAALGLDASAAGVAAHYGPALLDGWLVDEQDKAAADAPELAGITIRATPLYMSSPAATAAIARAALDLAAELRK
jgi:LPPG:FO 2-phospho-L-lactate transferase